MSGTADPDSAGKANDVVDASDASGSIAPKPLVVDREFIRKHGVAASFAWRAAVSLLRPTMSKLYCDMEGADSLYRESERMRTDTEPAADGPDLASALSTHGLLKNLDYIGFSIAQNSSRIALATSLVLQVDALFRQVRDAFQLPEGGKLSGPIPLTQLLRAAGNQIRHARIWRSKSQTEQDRIEDIVALRQAGLDPLRDDLPVHVVRVVGETYFGFEDAIKRAFDEILITVGPPDVDELIASLDGREFNVNVSMKLSVKKVDDS